MSAEILSCATYPSNMLYDGKPLSAFEVVRGYTPSISGLPSSSMSSPVRGVIYLNKLLAHLGVFTSPRPWFLSSTSLSRP